MRNKGAALDPIAFGPGCFEQESLKRRPACIWRALGIARKQVCGLQRAKGLCTNPGTAAVRWFQPEPRFDPHGQRMFCQLRIREVLINDLVNRRPELRANALDRERFIGDASERLGDDAVGCHPDSEQPR
jgi:hypothetical protein